MLEERVREAIIDELKRQAEISEGGLQVTEGDDSLTIHGPINVDELVMAAVGSIAGGP